MRRPSVENLAPATPEHVVSSQSSTLEPTDNDEVVVLESSPGRPGTSKAVRVDPGSVRRLDSFYFRGAPMRITAANNLPPASEDAVSEGQRTPVSETAGDLQHMGISPPPKPQAADFGDIVKQYRWRGEEENSNASDSEDSFNKKRPLDATSPDRRKRPAVDPPRPRRGRLLRGARPGSRAAPSSTASTSASPEPQPRAQARARRVAVEVVDSGSESDAATTEGSIRRSFANIDPHIMQLFNHGTSAELMEKTGATAAEAEAVIGLRPFEDVDDIEQSMRKNRGVRLALFNQHRDALLGHMEVENVIVQCSGMFAQLQEALEKAGVKRNENAIEVATDSMTQPQMVNGQFQLKHYQLE
ncbi:DNA-dependent ATPase fun30, partial [Coemansia biformis]